MNLAMERDFFCFIFLLFFFVPLTLSAPCKGLGARDRGVNAWEIRGDGKGREDNRRIVYINTKPRSEQVDRTTVDLGKRLGLLGMYSVCEVMRGEGKERREEKLMCGVYLVCKVVCGEISEEATMARKENRRVWDGDEEVRVMALGGGV